VRVSVRYTLQKVPVFSQRCGRSFAGRNLALLSVRESEQNSSHPNVGRAATGNGCTDIPRIYRPSGVSSSRTRMRRLRHCRVHPPISAANVVCANAHACKLGLEGIVSKLKDRPTARGGHLIGSR
jgi:hypothetical protein